ncbi:hypothetical protein ACWCQL_31700 [Streptomyces sp. NPDC002073]
MERIVDAAPQRWTARRWQLEHAQSLQEWRRSEASLAAPHLSTLCRATNDTARFLSSGPDGLGAQLLPTRTRCNELYFEDCDEVAAYTVQHLTDRYGRVTQVLEYLFAEGHIPLRKRRMSVLEVGAGPAPGLFAARDFYADMALWAESVHPQVPFLPVTDMHAVDRGPAWGWLLHHLSERLMSLRSGIPASTGAYPFNVQYDNFAGFSPSREHDKALSWAAEVISADFDRADEPITRGAARRFAEEDGVGIPSAYDLVIACNFLTMEDSVSVFRRELRNLASGLTPGGLVIAIGQPSYGKKSIYTGIWSDLRALMRGAGLTELKGFDKRFPANPVLEWARMIRRQRQEILDETRDVPLPPELERLQETDPFPPFQAFVWKNQRPPR